METFARNRTARRHAELESSQHAAFEGSLQLAESPDTPEAFRVDLERIRFSSYFARLSDVTQVVPQTGVGPVLHNRLTHSLKVSAVARVIAAQLAGHAAQWAAFERGETAERDETGRIIAELGGCDTVVAQAAAHAHDLGHPPFGHLGERVLDRLARTRLGLPEGFEGNAQTFRILTHLDTLGRDFDGLNLTAATRAATLKYPWTRAAWAGISLADVRAADRPRGAGINPLDGADKFSAYALEAAEMEEVLAAFPAISPGMQTVECAVMDLADDIAYAVHDLDDFAKAGVLQRGEVLREFSAWLASEGSLAVANEAELDSREAGQALELLWRRLQLKDRWIAERDAFADAVRVVAEEIGDGLLAVPYDGGIASERAISGFTRRWIDRLRSSIVVDENPDIRGGYVRLDHRSWHEVMVLKFVHAHFVLERPEHALRQRGQSRIIESITLGLDAWLSDPADASHAPRSLLEWVEEGTQGLLDLRASRPDLLTGDTSTDGLIRQGRTRAILDYVAGLSDQQAVQVHAQLNGAIV